MKRYSPTLEAESWANLDDHDTDVHAAMVEDQRGEWVRLVEAEQHCAQQSLQKLQELLQTRLSKGNVSVSGALERMIECEYLGREPDAKDEHIMVSLMETLGEFMAWLKANGND